MAPGAVFLPSWRQLSLAGTPQSLIRINREADAVFASPAGLRRLSYVKVNAQGMHKIKHQARTMKGRNDVREGNDRIGVHRSQQWSRRGGLMMKSTSGGPTIALLEPRQCTISTGTAAVSIIDFVTPPKIRSRMREWP